VAIAFDNTGSAFSNAATSLSIDITAAATGAWVYAYFQIGGSEPNGVTLAGWNKLIDQNEPNSGSHFAMFRRVKQSGDTTFSASFQSSQSVVAAWSSYTGLNSDVPDEGFQGASQQSTTSSYTTPTGTPVDNTRWALAAVGARSTVSAETWTAPASLTLRVQAVNTASRWDPVAIADSNGAVAASAQSYTFTLSASEAHGGKVLGFLVPSTATDPAYPPPIFERQALPRAATW
jgi:hypothetical protein